MTLCNSVNVSKEKGSSHVSVTGDVYAETISGGEALIQKLMAT